MKSLEQINQYWLRILSPVSVLMGRQKRDSSLSCTEKNHVSYWVRLKTALWKKKNHCLLAKQKNCAVLSTNNRAFELKICRHETVYLQGKMTHFSRNMTQFNLLEKKNWNAIWPKFSETKVVWKTEKCLYSSWGSFIYRSFAPCVRQDCVSCNRLWLGLPENFHRALICRINLLQLS